MRIALVTCLVLALAAPLQPAIAQVQGAQDRDDKSPGEVARDGIESLLRALEMFVDMIPQYEAPELTEDGDIIIRRKRTPDRSPPISPDTDETRT